MVNCIRCGEETEGVKVIRLDGFHCEECVEEYLETVECYCCEEVALKSHTKMTPNGDLVCEVCIEDEKYRKCYSCGDYFPQDETTKIDGNVYCDDCRGEQFYSCEQCGEYVAQDEAIFCANTVYCDPCADRYTFECDDCNNRFPNSAQNSVVGGSVCDSCYENYNYCDDCGESYPESNSCGCDSYSGDVDYSKEHGYSFKPDPVFYGSGPCYLGVELEVDEGTDHAKMRDTLHSCLVSHVYYKHDGSIDEGFELVSHPCSLDYHMYSINWREALENLSDEGYRSHDASSSCGLHVHISREAFGDNGFERDSNILKVLLMYERFWDKIKKFSRRTSTQIDRWAKRYGITDPNTLLAHAKRQDRYYAVNLNNKETVEFRIFRGSLKYPTFIATLQFCHELVRIAKELTLVETAHLTWEVLVTKFEYAELNTYLGKRGLLTPPTTECLHDDPKYMETTEVVTPEVIATTITGRAILRNLDLMHVDAPVVPLHPSSGSIFNVETDGCDGNCHNCTLCGGVN